MKCIKLSSQRQWKCSKGLQNSTLGWATLMCPEKSTRNIRQVILLLHQQEEVIKHSTNSSASKKMAIYFLFVISMFWKNWGLQILFQGLLWTQPVTQHQSLNSQYSKMKNKQICPAKCLSPIVFSIFFLKHFWKKVFKIGLWIIFFL